MRRLAPRSGAAKLNVAGLILAAAGMALERGADAASARHGPTLLRFR